MERKIMLTYEETLRFISYVVGYVFEQDEETQLDIEYRPYLKQIAISDMYNYLYLGKDLESISNEDYEQFLCMGIGIDVNEKQWDFMMDTIDEEIEIRKAKLLQPKSELEDMFRTINTVLETANSKLAELDIKGIEKIFKKLNIKELLKEYQKSGIGEDVRDKTIAQLSKELKEAKNNIASLTLKAQ